MRLTKFNEEAEQYEYIEKAKTLDEYRAQRKAAIQRLGELEDKASEVAEEIFAEIDRMCIDTFGNFNHRVFAELKKKYTESEKEND
jgi:hypothetical protein